jgi:heme/copper-type cytochrome/quinol oxidase subunit 1
MTSDQSAIEQFRSENRLTAAYLIVAHVALFIGVVLGLFQALEYAGINLYPGVTPLIQSYYHGLSLHGVLNVLAWTTFFISSFLTFITVRALGTPLQGMVLGWAPFAVMVAGLVITAVPLLGNQATVLFTFYPPMKAQGSFYLLGIHHQYAEPGIHLFMGSGWATRDVAMTAAIEWLLRVYYIVGHCSLEWDILSHIESKRPIRSMQVGQRCA